MTENEEAARMYRRLGYCLDDTCPSQEDPRSSCGYRIMSKAVAPAEVGVCVWGVRGGAAGLAPALAPPRPAQRALAMLGGHTTGRRGRQPRGQATPGQRPEAWGWR
jgi:hypothetical protein